MGNPVTTRERILDQGLALMSQAGLEGVTLGVLAEQVGMSKSGLFAHFRSKEEVQIRFPGAHAVVGAARIIAPSMKEPAGLPRLKALVQNWFGWATRAGLPGGCPVAAGMFEFDDVEGPVRDKISAMEAEWRGLLTKTVAECEFAGASAERFGRRAIRMGIVRHLFESSRSATFSEVTRCGSACADGVRRAPGTSRSG